ncbi:glycosyltransferase involved in cell wall biosynthesis [Flavobacterium cauense R2A-7]|uniref:Glycosyltransferase involved in cell wall biosynthesis n=1 Tax=Flavobacterium cauense R2A-7 TaxID=1341154 RepID=A0A562LX65_9FLAO|nr:glycosyltransferase [Flavobacterium cauense]TWI12143.1 glycosyltransferase involved in cell wall biosynthesis [Flavobacterium cauense R2A-7]
MNGKPLVSICMITYGHENYIREAIEGVLMQQCDFEIELVVSNDCSPDATHDVIHEILESHPNAYKLKYIKHENNIGMMPNFVHALQECRGKYIALCEGDDYWIDPLKLQKQIDFLEENQDYVLCFHKVKVLQSDGVLGDDSITEVPAEYETMEAMARYGNYIHTPSVVFRNCIKSFPEEFEKTPIGDYFLYMLLASHGKIKRLDETMAVYRHGVGVFSGNSSDVMLYKSTKTFVLIASALKDNKEIAAIMVYRVYRNLKFYSFQKNNDEANVFLKLLNAETDNHFLKYFLELYLPFVSENLMEKKGYQKRSTFNAVKYHLKEIIKTIVKK